MSADPNVSRFLGQITIKGQDHTHEFDESDLPRWLSFYRGMRADYGHRTETYGKIVLALEGLDA